MSDLKICSTCQRELSPELFEHNRRVCRACRSAEHRRRTSSSYEHFLRYLYSNAKSDASSPSSNRSNKIAWELELSDLTALWEKQEGRCAVSGVFLTHHKDGSGRYDFNASIDRINPDLPYTPQNVHLVAYRINIMKHTLTSDMFYWWVKTIHDFSCD